MGSPHCRPHRDPVLATRKSRCAALRLSPRPSYRLRRINGSRKPPLGCHSTNNYTPRAVKRRQRGALDDPRRKIESLQESLQNSHLGGNVAPAHSHTRGGRDARQFVDQRISRRRLPEKFEYCGGEDGRAAEDRRQGIKIQVMFGCAEARSPHPPAPPTQPVLASPTCPDPALPQPSVGDQFNPR